MALTFVKRFPSIIVHGSIARSIPSMSCMLVFNSDQKFCTFLHCTKRCNIAIKHALQIFTDASIEGWGSHLDEHTARGTWSLPGSKLHINYIGLKAVFLALKEFQDVCSNKILLVATDNTTVVSYINKEGGMRLGPLCALLWSILTWCTRKQVTLKPDTFQAG